MNTNIMRSKKVSSTEPTIGPICPFAMPSRSHAALEAKVIKDRDHQADEPPVALFGFPKPRLRMAISAVHRPSQAMHAALGESGLTGDLTNTRHSVVPKGVENQAAFRPKSHGGRSSDG